MYCFSHLPSDFTFNKLNVIELEAMHVTFHFYVSKSIFTNFLDNNFKTFYKKRKKSVHHLLIQKSVRY